MPRSAWRVDLACRLLAFNFIRVGHDHAVCRFIHRLGTFVSISPTRVLYVHYISGQRVFPGVEFFSTDKMGIIATRLGVRSAFRPAVVSANRATREVVGYKRTFRRVVLKYPRDNQDLAIEVGLVRGIVAAEERRR